MLKSRAMLMRLIVAVVFLGLAGRLSWIQVVRAADITRRSEEQRLVNKELEPLRGSIVDRADRTLAVTVPVFTAVANAMLVRDPADVAAKLAGPLQMPKERIEQLIRDNPQSGYIKLKTKLGQQEALAIQRLRIDGVTMESTTVRYYPQGATANQVVGYLTSEGKDGEYGLEQHYNKELKGEPGFVRAEITGSGIPIEETIKAKQEPKPGLNLVLSIDAAVQQLAEAKLDEVVQKTKAKRALTIAMDIHTGEILLMAMRPGANPGDRNTWLKPNSTEVDFSKLINWSVSPLPPGSIFKQITTAAALEENTISLTTPFLDSGIMRIDGATIRNWDGYTPPKPRPMTIAELLQNSSNIGLIQVGQTLKHDQFVKYLKGFGFMEPTGIDFSHEDGAVGLSGFDQKREIDWANMYIGQHLEVTPVQMITAAAAVANGGMLMQPHLVREMRDPEGKVVWTAPTGPRRQVITAETAKEVRDLMVSVVEKGTAGLAKVPGYTVGGKTGTAQKFENGRMKDRNGAHFVGFAPASNPQVVMLVMIDEPEGAGYGGMLAAPVFSELMPHVMRAMGIAPDSPAARGEEVAPPKATTGVVPNLLGLPVAWAKERLVQNGFISKTVGAGPVVTAQSLKPGALERIGATVELTLQPRGTGGEEKVLVPDFSGLSIAEASQLAAEVGLTVRAGGTGFVADQDPKAGTTVPARSSLGLRLAPPNR